MYCSAMVRLACLHKMSCVNTIVVISTLHRVTVARSANAAGSQFATALLQHAYMFRSMLAWDGAIERRAWYALQWCMYSYRTTENLVAAELLLGTNGYRRSIHAKQAGNK